MEISVDCHGDRFGPAGVSLCWMGSVLDHWQGSWPLHRCVELRPRPAAGGQMTKSGAAVGLGSLYSECSLGRSTCDFKTMSTGTGQLWGGSQHLPGLVRVTDHVGEVSRNSQTLPMKQVNWVVVYTAAKTLLKRQVYWGVVYMAARTLLMRQVYGVVVFMAARVWLMDQIHWLVVIMATRVLLKEQINLVVGVVAAREILLEQFRWEVVCWAARVMSGEVSIISREVSAMVMSGGQANSNRVVDNFPTMGNFSGKAYQLWMVYMAMARGLVFMYMRNMLGIVYMVEMTVELFFYKNNIFGLDYMASWNMFIHEGCLLGVFYMGVKHGAVFCLKANKVLVCKAKKGGIKFFMVENEGLVFMTKLQRAVRQEPCQVEEVLIGDVVQAIPGEGHQVDEACHGLTVGEVSDEANSHNLSGGQAGTAPLDEVVGDQYGAALTVQLEDGYGRTHYGLSGGGQGDQGGHHGHQGDDQTVVGVDIRKTEEQFGM